MCPNFCMLYYLENTELTECRTCWHTRYKIRTGRGITLSIKPELAGEELLFHIENKNTSQSLLDCKGYSHLQILPSTWHEIIHMMWWMESWCTHPMVKFGKIWIRCILIFQWNQGTYVLGYIPIDSIYSGYLLVLIFVGRRYSQLTTCH